MELQTVARNAQADNFDDLVNTGTGTAEARLETSAGVEVATFALPNPAFGAAADGTITLQGVPITDTNATGGTVAQMRIYSRAGTALARSAVATSGAEITITSTTIAAGDQVTLTSLTVTVPAGSP